jgi:hypothetical protein
MNDAAAIGSQLVGFEGANPFQEGQAKTSSDAKLIAEFFPTSTFWSRLNQQHEILLGTRGSGKTAILKMLSYSCFRHIKDEKAERVRKEKAYIGFYIPLHLEFLSSLPGKDVGDEQRLEYFQFAFNCAAIKSLLSELRSLIEDLLPDSRSRLLKEDALVSDLYKLWFPKVIDRGSALTDLVFEVDCLFQQQGFWRDGSQQNVHPFANSLFWPVLPALARITELLSLNPAVITWIACIDEAEFLSPAFQRCINHFLRSEKKPLVLKVATLPFKHVTRETLTPGVQIEAGGNDFNYRKIDLLWDSGDFRTLTDRLCARRLKECGVPAAESMNNITLERFFGVEGGDDLIDYYRAEFPDEATEEKILSGIVAALSETRRRRYEAVKEDPSKVEWAFLKRFAPVFYVRRMREANSRGNRTGAWLAGATMVRRIADGNPRRFIQLMNQMFEAARQNKLSFKSQHRINMDFSRSQFRFSEGLPDHGVLLKGILDIVAHLLEEKVHGKEMIDAGCAFTLKRALLDSQVIQRTLELGVGYSYLFVDDTSLTEGLKEETEFRLAHLVAACFWLPMRRGEKIVLQSRHAAELLNVQSPPPRTQKEGDLFVRELNLDLVFKDE